MFPSSSFIVVKQRLLEISAALSTSAQRAHASPGTA
jgi:hypothetical protein